MPVTAESFYERLSLPRSAGPDEIVRAWRRLILVHPSNRDLEASRRIQEAYDTLSEARVKLAYDIGLPPAAQRWLSTGLEALTARDYGTAARHLKLVVVESPESHYARNLLGLCLLYDEKPAEAHAEFECLQATASPAACWWSNDARALRKLNRFDEAENALTQAIAHVGERAADCYLALADLLAERGEIARARDTIEEGIRSDDFAGFRDPRFPLASLRLALASGEDEAVEREISRVRLFATEPELRTYAAWELAQLARMLIDAKQLERAAPIAAAASALDPTNDEIEGVVRLAPPRRGTFPMAMPLMRTPRLATPKLASDALEAMANAGAAAKRLPAFLARMLGLMPGAAREFGHALDPVSDFSRSFGHWYTPRRFRAAAAAIGAVAAALVLVAGITAAIRRTRAAAAEPPARVVADTLPPVPSLARAQLQAWITSRQALLDVMRQKLIVLDDAVGTGEVEVEAAAQAMADAQRAMERGHGDRLALSRLVRRHNKLVRVQQLTVTKRDSLAGVYDSVVNDATRRIAAQKLIHEQPGPR